MKNFLLFLSATATVLGASALSAGAEMIPMIDSPLFGSIPVDIAEACAREAGVTSIDELMTDTHFEIYEGCGVEYLGEFDI
jgi:hypothetical protein